MRIIFLATVSVPSPNPNRSVQGEFTYLGDTWVLDIESMAWQEVRCGGDLPNPRYGHSCHLVGSRMFIVGGKGQNGQLYRDVHFLDLVDWTWVAVNATSTGPTPRHAWISVVSIQKCKTTERFLV